MTNLCLYFQIHQPYRMGGFSIFDVGNQKEYFDNAKNQEVMEKVAGKCYLPATSILIDSAKQHPGTFKVAFSITGTALEQMKSFAPLALEKLQELNDLGCAEFLSETYYHSLSYLFDKDEFVSQIKMHRHAIKKTFGQKPSIFRNTELVHFNELGLFIEKMGYKGILAEGADHILGWRSPNYVYHSKTTKNLRMLLKKYRLSDDIAFRFSQRSWEGWPLTASKFVDWIHPALGDSINLFMDYETFGEHQWHDTGIFDFLSHLPSEALSRGIGFHTPSEAIQQEPKGEIDMHTPVSWADVERDTSAWLGNRMQDSASARLYALSNTIMESKDKELIESWRRLTTSDHFYYMCTKWFNDGDVHKYFNPYDSPYESYIAFMNILQDMEGRARKVSVVGQSER